MVFWWLQKRLVWALHRCGSYWVKILFTPRMRPQAIDVQAAVMWGVAAGTTALWLVQEAIFRVVAAILHLKNIEFAKGKEIYSSVPKDDKYWFHLKTAAELFMCDPKALEDSLCKRVIVTRDETITKWLDPESAVTSRDALAKIVYSRLVDWLVDNINSSIGQDPDSKFLIGVLDIYGFESFMTNRILNLAELMWISDLKMMRIPDLHQN